MNCNRIHKKTTSTIKLFNSKECKKGSRKIASFEWRKSGIPDWNVYYRDKNGRYLILKSGKTEAQVRSHEVIDQFLEVWPHCLIRNSNISDNWSSVTSSRWRISRDSFLTFEDTVSMWVYGMSVQSSTTRSIADTHLRAVTHYTFVFFVSTCSSYAFKCVL